jgi:PfaD family protein
MKDSSLYSALVAIDRPCYVLRSGDGLTATNDDPRPALPLASAPAIDPGGLGSPDFLTRHGVRYPYVAGAMANGIASARFVAAMAKSGLLAAFGSAGLSPARIEGALTAIERDAPGLPFACNLIHSPDAPERERQTVDLYLERRVRCVEASAFFDLTPDIVRYRVAGFSRDRSGRVRAENRVVAKVSRVEAAERFLRPAPPALVAGLLERGQITAEQAELASSLPMADDLTAEADSGGHTDRRPLTVLLPELIRARDRIQAEHRFVAPVRVGAAGGIGTPAAAHAAFALGADYIVTGSVNQASVEAAQSTTAKRLLAEAGVSDCVMAPSADMFELGVKVQVLKRGTLFAANASRLYALYRRHGSLEEIPATERASLEKRVFRRSLAEVWHDTRRYLEAYAPGQLERAIDNPKRRMALVFRWYLGLSSAWSIAGDADRVGDYQLWCGPAMGAFNSWVAGSHLAPIENRYAADIARHLMTGAAFAARVHHLRVAGVRLPASCSTYVPAPLRKEVPA